MTSPLAGLGRRPLAWLAALWGFAALVGLPSASQGNSSSPPPPSQRVLELQSPGSPMVFFPHSTWTMGSTPDEVVQAFADCTAEPLGQLCRVELFGDEGPVREVSLSSFFLDRNEVTVAQYRRCVAVGRCQPPPYFRGATRFERDSFPVTLVSWDDAREFCAFRGARLPTEAEFERAARGKAGRRFPWGNLFHRGAANHGRLGSDRTDQRDGYAELAPTGSFPQGATPNGVFDLGGNVEEWVQDRYLPEYDPRDLSNPTGPSDGMASGPRVVRGGSFESPKAWLRGASRDPADPQARYATRGFRCASSKRQPAFGPSHWLPQNRP